MRGSAYLDGAEPAVPADLRLHVVAGEVEVTGDHWLLVIQALQEDLERQAWRTSKTTELVGGVVILQRPSGELGPEVALGVPDGRWDVETHLVDDASPAGPAGRWGRAAFVVGDHAEGEPSG